MASEEFKRFIREGKGFKPPEKQENIDYHQMRRDMEKMLAGMHQPPDDVEYTRVEIRGLSAEWVIPDGSPGDKAVLYFHGGGFTGGSVATHRHFTAAIARESGIKTVALEYSLAPENPYPAALDDCLSTYRGLLEQGIPAGGIILAGDSAGGNLSLASVLYLKASGEALPAAVMAIAPVTDFKATGASYRTRAEDPLAGIIREIYKAYAPDEDLDNPYISPLYGDYQNFPPLFLQVGTGDVLLDDAAMLAEKAIAAGVDVTLRVWEEMGHVFAMDIGHYPEADEGVREIGAYIRSYLGNRIR